MKPIIFFNSPRFRIILVLVLIVGMIFLVLFWNPILVLFEPHPPVRDFNIIDLLLNKDSLTPSWSSFVPFYPSGDDLATKESIAIRFGKINENGENEYLAEHAVYRYDTSGIALRVFENKIKTQKTLEKNQDWKFLSSVANQTYFGCYKQENRISYCQWAGVYEEFIIVFDTKMIVGEMTITDMERIVREIDMKMATYLDILTLY